MTLFWWCLNALRRWHEDRSVPEASTVQQWKRLWARAHRTVIPMNLRLVRDQRVRRIA